MNAKEFAGIVILVLFFVAGMVVAREFSSDVVTYLDSGVLGMVMYVLVGIVSTIIAPISTVMLIPVATVLWGPFAVAILSIIAWTVGSIIAFVIARRFGKPLIMRFVNLQNIEKYEKALGGEYLFWNIVFLRMAVPVDILSYAIGLFTSIRIDTYIVATIIGITPFAFILPFAVQASLWFQIIVGLLVFIIIYLGYRKVKRVTF